MTILILIGAFAVIVVLCLIGICVLTLHDDILLKLHPPDPEDDDHTQWPDKDGDTQ